MPLDTCEVDEAIVGYCLSQSQRKKPNPGTIMSYCGWINWENGLGYRVGMRFHPVVIAGMRQYISGLSCLDEVVVPIPQPLYPVDDTVAERTVAFRWSADWDADFIFELQGDTTLTLLVHDATSQIDLNPGAYRWRVKATTIGASGEWSAWSSIYLREGTTSVRDVRLNRRRSAIDLW